MNFNGMDRKLVQALPLPTGSADSIIFDDTLKGFGVRLRLDAGGKVIRSWVAQFRVNGRQGRLKIGDVAKLSPEQARKKATELLAQATLGTDPAGKRAEDRKQNTITLRSVIDQFLRTKEKQVETDNLRPASLKAMKIYLTGDYFGPLHSKAINAITRADVAVRLNAITNDRSANTAKQARVHFSAFYGWAMREGIALANPVLATNEPDGSAERDRVLSNDELRRIWLACQDDEYGKIVKLLMLTGCRRAEIGKAQWSWVDMEKGTLTIPEKFTKNHRKHELPLSDSALDIIRTVPQLVGSDYLFGQRGFNFNGRSAHHLVSFSEPWKLHDLRRTLSTRLHEMGIAPHFVEAVLNHTGHKSGTAGVYNHADYKNQMRRAVSMWADHVRSIVDNTATKVVHLQQLKQA
jgi:integrase